MPRPALGYAATVAAAGFFAVNGTVSTLALQAGIPATRLTALRCTGAAIALVAVLAVAAPHRLRVTWRELPLLAAFGVVGVALTQFLYYVAIGRLPVGIALVFEMTAPVFIALYVWLVRGERVRSRLWAALLLSLSGLVFVAQVWQGGGSLDPLGVALAAVAGTCWMAYIYLSKRVGAAFPGGSGLAIAMAVGALVVLPAGVLEARGALTEPTLLGATFVVAIASSVLPYSLELVALRRLPKGVFGVLMSLDPAVAALAGVVMLEQGLGARDVAGIALVVVASAGAAALSHREPATGRPVSRSDVRPQPP